MNELDAAIKAYRRYGKVQDHNVEWVFYRCQITIKELKDYKDQTVKAHVITEHMRLLLLEGTEQAQS